MIDARRLILAVLAASLAVGLGLPVNAAELCLHGCPTGGRPNNRIIERSIYVLSNNGSTKFADWVAYRVTKETIGPSQQRIWHRDPDLPDNETLSPADYAGIRAALHADRGHQAPLASLTGTPDWDMADYLSNITPQATDLNEGAWERLENAERSLAKRQDVSEVYSITGPLYEHDMPRLPHAHLNHRVPSGYWKVIAVERGNDLRVAAFVFDQETPRDEDICQHAVTVREVETRSHLNLFPKLAQTRQDEIEPAPGQLTSDLGCR